MPNVYSWIAATAVAAALWSGRLTPASPLPRATTPSRARRTSSLVKPDPGTTINGTTNLSNTPVQFTSTQTLATGGIGQGFLEVSGNTPPNPIPLTNFTFTVPGHTFGDFIFNAFNGAGTELVTVVTNLRTVIDSFPLANGSNFLTIIAGGGETIESVSVSAPRGFTSLRQPRVSEISGVSVPEPVSMALLGMGLLGLGVMRSRKR